MRGALRPVASGVAAGLLACLALAGGHPRIQIQPYISGEIIRDDNLFRLSPNLSPDAVEAELGTTSLGDTIQRTILGVELEAPGRVHSFAFNGALSRNRYQEFSSLDHDASIVGGSWNWVLGKTFQGSVGYDYERSLTDFSSVRTRQPVLSTAQDLHADFVYDMTHSWRLRSQVSRFTLRRDANEGVTALADRDATAAEIDIYFETPTQSTVGFVGMLEDGVFIRDSGLVRDHYQVIRTAGQATGSFSSKSEWTARLGVDFGSGDRVGGNLVEPVGLVRFVWRPGPKSSILLRADRVLRASDDIEAGFAVEERLAIEPAWSVIHRLFFVLEAGMERRAYENSLNVIVQDNREEEDLFGGLSVVIKPSVHVDLRVSYVRGDRDSNRPLQSFEYEVLSFDIRVNPMGHRR